MPDDVPTLPAAPPMEFPAGAVPDDIPTAPASPASAPGEALPDFPPEYNVVVETPPASAPGEALPDFPPEYNEDVAPPEPTIGQRIWQRFMGTDVANDPQEWSRMGAAAAGAVAGGMAGARTPVAPGPLGVIVNPITGGLLGGAIGAAIGAATPEAVLAAGELSGLLNEGTREHLGLNPTDLQTVIEGEVLLDLATGGGFTAARLIGRPVARVMGGVGRKGRELARRAAELDIFLMPVQVGDRKVARGFVAVMGRFPFIGTTIRKRGGAAENALQLALETAATRVGPAGSAADLSVRIFDDATTLLKETQREFRDRYTAMWLRADQLGVQVVPRGVVNKADEILKKIQAKTPVTIDGVAGDPGPALQPVVDCIPKRISPFRDTSTGAVIHVKQSYLRMDGLVELIDQEIAAMEPSQKRFALSMMHQLRQSALADMTVNARGINSGLVVQELKTINTDFSHTMSEIFETATAKRFGTVRKRGLRGVEFDDATRTNVDQLARLVVKLDSPQAIDELSRLVTPDTFKRMASQVLDHAITDATNVSAEVGRRFNPDVFAKRLGLDAPGSSRYQAVEGMLNKAAGLRTDAIRITDLDALLNAAKAISNLDIPNVNTFIARRATLGGTRALINGVVPGLAFVGGVGASGNLLATTVGAAMFLGGGKLVSAMLSNPNSVRALRAVAQSEARTIATQRKFIVIALRGGLNSLQEAGDIGAERIQDLESIMNEMLDSLDQQMEDMF